MIMRPTRTMVVNTARISTAVSVCVCVRARARLHFGVGVCLSAFVH